MAGKNFWERFEDYMAAATFAEAGETEAARDFIRPRRKVLLALAPGGNDTRSAAYARSVAARIGAEVETVTATGCLKKKILERTSGRSDIDFVVIESSGELDIQCEEETRSLKDFIASLRIPLVVVSETQGMA